MNQDILFREVEITGSDGQSHSYPRSDRALYLSLESEDESGGRAPKPAPALTIKPPPHPEQKEWCIQAVAWSTYYSLINLGHKELHLQVSNTPASGELILQPHDTLRIAYEAKVTIGHVAFVFYRRKIAENFAIDFSLREAKLREDHTADRLLKGFINLYHTGKTDRPVQFHITVEIEGMPSDAHRIDSPEPNLDNNIRKYPVALQLGHPPGRPIRAGRYRIDVVAKADEYPGEEAIDSQLVEVMPFYKHILSLESGFGCNSTKGMDQV